MVKKKTRHFARQAHVLKINNGFRPKRLRKLFIILVITHILIVITHRLIVNCIGFKASKGR